MRDAISKDPRSAVPSWSRITLFGGVVVVMAMVASSLLLVRSREPKKKTTELALPTYPNATESPETGGIPKSPTYESFIPDIPQVAAVMEQSHGAGEVDVGPEAAAERETERIRKMNERFEVESVDPTWSAEFNDHLRAGVAALGSQIVASECRRTICRLRVRHTDSDAANTFTNRFPQLVSGAAAIRIHNEIIGTSYEDEIHVFRKGSPLP